MDNHIDEFCFTPSTKIYGAVRRRRSILIELQADIDYNLGIYSTFKDIAGITEDQINKIEKLSPMLAVPHLFFSAVDLLARVKYKSSKVPRGMNKQWFIESATQFFGLSEDIAEELWKFRNGIVHHYSLGEFVISRSGSSNIFEIQQSGKVVFVRAMRGSLQAAINRFAEYLQSENVADKKSTAAYLESNGYSYSLISDEELMQL